MKNHIRAPWVLPVSGIAGGLSTGILLAVVPAWAQTSSVEEIELSPEGLEILCERSPSNSRCIGTDASSQAAPTPPEVELSPEGLRILCQTFPLNSRCEGGSPLTQSPSEIPTASPSPSTTPEATQDSSDLDNPPSDLDNSSEESPASTPPSTNEPIPTQPVPLNPTPAPSDNAIPALW